LLVTTFIDAFAVIITGAEEQQTGLGNLLLFNDPRSFFHFKRERERLKKSETLEGKKRKLAKEL
jgi:hypothetical protein